MSKHAAIYARVSTEVQDYNRQVNELTALAKKDGFTQIEVFAESISGYKKEERIELQRMLNICRIKPSYFGCIYVSELSRLGRARIQTRHTIDELTQLKVNIFIQNLNMFTLDENKNMSMLTSIMMTLYTEISNQEAETFKARSRSGLLQSAKNGRAGGGASLAYGYKRGTDKMLVVDENEVSTVKKIFNHYRQGNGIKAISNLLNDEGIPTKNRVVKGKKITWSDRQVHAILNNTLYKGERRFKGHVLQAPAIVDKDLFDECQGIMKGKTHKNYLTIYTYLLKDMVTCGVCGRNYFARYKPQDNEEIYMCSSKLKKGCSCGSGGINISLIESAIYNELVNSESILKYINNTKGLKTQLENDVKKYEQHVGNDTSLRNKKVKEKERLLDVYLSAGIDKETFTNKQEKIINEIENLTKKIKLFESELKSKRKSLQNLDDVKTTKKMLEKAKHNRSELQAIYRQVINRVVIDSTDSESALISVYFQVNGEVLSPSIKYFLNLAGMRKKTKVYSYSVFPYLDNVHHIEDKNLILINKKTA
jgi:DNA invertase Pin-like site-specific DNA recombinase